MLGFSRLCPTTKPNRGTFPDQKYLSRKTLRGASKCVRRAPPIHGIAPQFFVLKRAVQHLRQKRHKKPAGEAGGEARHLGLQQQAGGGGPPIGAGGQSGDAVQYVRTPRPSCPAPR